MAWLSIISGIVGAVLLMAAVVAVGLREGGLTWLHYVLLTFGLLVISAFMAIAALRVEST